MKTHDEIKKCLEYCHSAQPCVECEYDDRDFPHCVRRLLGDAIEGYNLLEQSLAQVERERDAAVADLTEAVLEGAVCTGCKHKIGLDDACEAADFDCNECQAPCMCRTCEVNSNYEWRGICVETTHDQPIL